MRPRSPWERPTEKEWFLEELGLPGMAMHSLHPGSHPRRRGPYTVASASCSDPLPCFCTRWSPEAVLDRQRPWACCGAGRREPWREVKASWTWRVLVPLAAPLPARPAGKDILPPKAQLRGPCPPAAGHPSSTLPPTPSVLAVVGSPWTPVPWCIPLPDGAPPLLPPLQTALVKGAGCLPRRPSLC